MLIHNISQNIPRNSNDFCSRILNMLESLIILIYGYRHEEICKQTNYFQNIQTFLSFNFIFLSNVLNFSIYLLSKDLTSIFFLTRLFINIYLIYQIYLLSYKESLNNYYLQLYLLHLQFSHFYLYIRH